MDIYKCFLDEKYVYFQVPIDRIKLQSLDQYHQAELKIKNSFKTETKYLGKLYLQKNDEWTSYAGHSNLKKYAKKSIWMRVYSHNYGISLLDLAPGYIVRRPRHPILELELKRKNRYEILKESVK